MLDESLPPESSLHAGYEVRDGSTRLIVATVATFLLLSIALLALLWEVSRQVVPEQKEAGTAPPVVMPGDVPVNDRIQALPPPRLDALQPLAADPPTYRSSRPEPGSDSPDQRPEDLRANRQPALNGYAWVERGKVARIPIGTAMDAVIEAEHFKSTAKKGGGK